MIGIIMPTRGMVFTEVEDAIENIRQSTWQKIRIYRSWDKKIPDGINVLTEQALLNPAISHLWYIEEDTIPPVGSLQQLLYSSADISFIDYGVKGWSCHAKDDSTKEMLWCGLGCTLVKRSLFDRLDKPYFRTDKKLRLNTMEWVDTNEEEAYGGQDIWFCVQARAKGARIDQIPGECRHIQLNSVGKPEVNNGLHIISDKPNIIKYQIIHQGGDSEWQKQMPQIPEK